MNIFASFRKKIEAQIEGLAAAGDLPEGLDLSRITLEPPRDASHGDIACNAALSLFRIKAAIFALVLNGCLANGLSLSFVGHFNEPPTVSSDWGLLSLTA